MWLCVVLSCPSLWCSRWRDGRRSWHKVQCEYGGGWLWRLLAGQCNSTTPHSHTHPSPAFPSPLSTYSMLYAAMVQSKVVATSLDEVPR